MPMGELARLIDAHVKETIENKWDMSLGYGTLEMPSTPGSYVAELWAQWKQRCRRLAVRVSPDVIDNDERFCQFDRLVGASSGLGKVDFSSNSDLEVEHCFLSGSMGSLNNSFKSVTTNGRLTCTIQLYASAFNQRHLNVVEAQFCKSLHARPSVMALFPKGRAPLNSPNYRCEDAAISQPTVTHRITKRCHSGTWVV